MSGVSLNIATYSKRRKSFRAMLKSVEAQKYDFALNIYLNDYKCPKWLNDWADKQGFLVTIVEGQSAEGDLKAAGKFYFADVHKGPYITADDDILLPDDYVGYMHHLIEKHKGAFVSFHAYKYGIKPVTGFYMHRSKVWQYGEGCRRDTVVDHVGTGVLGFDASLIDISHKYFEGYETMTDPMLTLFATERKIKMVTPTRAANWLQTVKGSQDVAIWRGHDKDMAERIEILNRAFALKAQSQ